jgi:uncharacterized membrane protein HdeD (DUF308 family)
MRPGSVLSPRSASALLAALAADSASRQVPLSAGVALVGLGTSVVLAPIVATHVGIYLLACASFLDALRQFRCNVNSARPLSRLRHAALGALCISFATVEFFQPALVASLLTVALSAILVTRGIYQLTSALALHAQVQAGPIGAALLGILSGGFVYLSIAPWGPWAFEIAMASFMIRRGQAYIQHGLFRRQSP